MCLKKLIKHFSSNEERYDRLKYERVCIVTINHSNSLTCSCGYVCRFLRPCAHVCSVIEKKKYMHTYYFMFAGIKNSIIIINQVLGEK